MQRPLIGVTTSFGTMPDNPSRLRSYLNAAYTDAVLAAGGLPMPLPVPPAFDDALLSDLIRRIDGLLFTGGPDLNPRHYGQTRHERTEVLHERRDAFDIALFAAADRSRIPVLSICLGCQIASVARGGCLVQHVDDLKRPSPVEHYKPDHSPAWHEVTVDPESRLAKIVGALRFEVNSRHHQIVDRRQVGGRLKPVAFAPDGIVEAVEDMKDRFMLAVQWHPEDLIDRAEHLRLFEALVREARSRTNGT